jgi:putative membrane protein
MDHHTPEHGRDGISSLPEAMLPALALLLAATAYLLLAGRARRRNPVQGWGRWRTASSPNYC